ncbi:MAG: hypothetical protein PHF79_03965 [Candidatus Pacebacteria bacterium]|nr:hypothetical protein [Candidatus Paceibacterota bacterium]
MILDTIKIFVPAVLSFFIGIAITPSLTSYFYAKKMWKHSSRSKENCDAMSVAFQKIHNENGELRTPRVGGVIIWLSVLATSIIFSLLAIVFHNPTSAASTFSLTDKMDFLSKNQTLLPLLALIFASIIGLLDDMLQIYGNSAKWGDGISRKYRILVVLLIGAIGAWWFYFKLGVLSVHIPFDGDIYLGLLFIPFFMLVMLGVFSGSVIDGIDGLAGGVLIPSFVSYMIIAFSQNQIDLAAFCAVIAGGILAFLWFNIPPARFYMGETGMLGLTVTLSIIAFLTREVLLLPLIAFPLFVTSLSSSIQMFSKKYFGRKVFRIAPIHHHFEALGWPSYKVTMRFWIISVVCCLMGTVLALIG